MEGKTIPEEVRALAQRLTSQKYRAYLVGGCVRDLLLGREPKDWDITTNARPDDIQTLFPDSVYENDFGTVAVKTNSFDPKLKIIEVTTYRKEGRYTDKRHPDEITFSEKIEEDLARRDFTINAIAMTCDEKPRYIDPFDGQKDIKQKIIQTVGDPRERFDEDALRLLRAIRFSAELNMAIEKKTAEAIIEKAHTLEMIAKERIRDEFTKIVMSDHPADGMRMLHYSGLMKYISLEILEGVDVGQNKHHIHTVFEHNIRALQYTAEKKYSLVVRLSALLHDVGKPRTKKGDGYNSTFYNHDVVGAKMTVKILDRLRYPKKIIESVEHLVRYHLFYYNVGEVTEAGVRRFIKKVGVENIDDLIKVREADRIGSGVPKAVPYKLRHLLFMIEKVKKDPISTSMLTLDGSDVMRLGNIEPGPRVGYILAVLLEEVLDDPQKNTEAYLAHRIATLNSLSDKQLQLIAGEAKKKKAEHESGIESEIKKKFHVS